MRWLLIAFFFLASGCSRPVTPADYLAAFSVCAPFGGLRHFAPHEFNGGVTAVCQNHVTVDIPPSELSK